MFEPDSQFVLVLLIGGSIALLVTAIRVRRWPLRAACGGLALTVAMSSGVAVVNDYYGYYHTWGALAADFGGGNVGDLPPAGSTTAEHLRGGTVGWVTLAGAASGYTRRGLVYLPPQYFQPQYAHVRFPVLELFHGSPGYPQDWLGELQLDQFENKLLASHRVGPTILVMPSINGPGHDYQDCVDGAGITDATYLTTDVRTDILSRFRASSDPAEWAAIGYSSGGFCAANLALRYPSMFGAAAALEGYFRAQDGPAAAALRGDATAEAANSPLYLARQLRAGAGPIPAFWIAAGTADGTDFTVAKAFAQTLDRVEQVPFETEINAAHTARAWTSVLPTALTWAWQQIAPPELRVLFPVRATIGNLTITLPPPRHRHRRYGSLTPSTTSIPTPGLLATRTGTRSPATASATSPRASASATTPSPPRPTP